MAACLCTPSLAPWRPASLSNGCIVPAVTTFCCSIPRRQLGIARASAAPSSLAGHGYHEDGYEREELNEDVDSFAYLVNTVQCILHFKYRVGHLLDENDTELIIDQVLRFHPRAYEKIGCGLSAIMVNLHPEYQRSRCFIIKRVDGTTCDFSYRKCMLERARLKGIDTFIARKLLNMDYMDIAQTMS